jgi:NDP-sugar pyrophosphorylase family protein
MQIVIPMSGFGERFRAAGYPTPKPLIEIDGKPVIEHVIDLFPGERDFVFVCNQDHLDAPAYRMREILERACPTGRIVGIAPHKLGPVHATRYALEHLDPARPLIVNYCDFTCYWCYEHFVAWINEAGCDGAVPAYRGFHPHSLGSTNYAYISERNGWLNDIQEKQPFTTDRMAEYASSGTYYFARASLFADYAERAIDRGLAVKGEYYVSLLYKLMAAEGLAIGVYPLQHFMQWGTPEDVAEYREYSDMFRRLLNIRSEHVPQQSGTTVVPMAGAGARFTAAGYALPKPLIPVSGRPMAVQAALDLPRAEAQIFVMRRDLPGVASITGALQEQFPRGRCIILPELTDGQARTVLLALHELEEAQMTAPLTIGACDNGLLYPPSAFSDMMSDQHVDIIVWAARAHAGAIRNPRIYSWLQTSGTDVWRVSMKAPVGSPANGLVVTGAFTFKRAADFFAAVNRMIAAQDRTNGEFYVDATVNHAIALGLKCKAFIVDNYVCWGTPDELRTFRYWQSCFHKWTNHPYSLFEDSRIAPLAAQELDREYAPAVPAPLQRGL